MRFIIFLLLIVLAGCHKTIKTSTEFFTWINNPSNGLIQTKRVDGLELKVKYLPTEYLVLKELKGKYNAKDAEILKKQYANSLSFLLTITPKDNSEGDVMYRDIKNTNEYMERLMSLQFRASQYIKLKTSKKEYAPLLTTLEDTYGTTKYRNLYMVFGGEDIEEMKKEKEWDIVFDDEIFGTGIHHFQYKTQTLLNLPTLNFWTNN